MVPYCPNVYTLHTKQDPKGEVSRFLGGKFSKEFYRHGILASEGHIFCTKLIVSKVFKISRLIKRTKHIY